MKQFIFWIILFVFSLGIVLMGTELLLRLVPNELSKSGPIYIPHPKLGATLLPNQSFQSVSSCFNAEVTINSNGFRDKNRSELKSKPRYAFLGDSMVEAIQVDDDNVFNMVLEKRYPDYEFLNFGRSGFGTVQEFLLYQDIVRKYHPDIVVLMFLPGNDIRNNVEKLQKQVETVTSPFATLSRESSEIEIYFPKPPQRQNSPLSIMFQKVKHFLRKHLALYRFTRSLMSILKVNLSQSNSNLPNDSSKNDQTYKFEKKWLDYNIYIPFEKNHSDWRRAWLVTEKLLLKFKEEVEADGNQFVLAILNDSLHFYPDYRIQTNIEFPEEFDPRYPSQRLIEFAKANNIRFLDFNRYFKQIRVAL